MEGTTEVGDQRARWYAWEEIRASLGRDEPPVAERQELATRCQLVTPWSGAVVLERKEDYTKHDLEQIDPSTASKVPTIPKPSFALLVILGVFLFVFRRRRRT